MVLYTEWVAARDASPDGEVRIRRRLRQGRVPGTELLSRIPRINRAKPSLVRQSRA
jgi:hypothetical protein